MKMMEKRMDKQEEDIENQKKKNQGLDKDSMSDNIQNSGSELAEKLVERLAKHFPKPTADGHGDEGENFDFENIEKGRRAERVDSDWSKQLDEQLRSDARKQNTRTSNGSIRMDMLDNSKPAGQPRMEKQEDVSRWKENGNEKIKNKRGMKALCKWFGDETSTEGESTDGDDNE